MNKCASCGYENLDNATFCASCGKDLTAQNEQPQQTPASEPKADRVNVNPSLNSVFVSNDEYVVATLSNGVVDNIITGEGFKTEDAVLTNKRMYYKHKTGIINIHSQVEVVDVKDITGTKILNRNPFGALIFSILMLIAGVIVFIDANRIEILVSAALAAVVLLVIYLIARRSHLRIEYAGGAIYFSVKRYRKSNILNFQKSIYAVKDHIDSRCK